MNRHGHTERVLSKGLLVALAIFATSAFFVWHTFRQRPFPPRTTPHRELAVFQGKDADYWLSESSSPDRATRRTAQLALGKAGADALPILCYLLASDNELVRQQAEQTLSAIGAPVVSDILAFLKDDNANVRLHVARLLASLQPQDEKVAQALAAALEDQQDAVIAEAAYALANMREHAAPATQALTKILRYHHPVVRIMAAEALAAIGPGASSAVPMLVRALDDADVGVRRSAAQAIGRIGPPAALVAIDHLTEKLADDEPYVCMAAATALGRIGPAANAAMPTLKSLQNDSVRLAEVEWAIARIRGDHYDPLNSYAPQTNSSTLLMPPIRETSSGNWPMLAGRPDRNAVVAAKTPTDWDLERGINVLWQVHLGNLCFAGPAVANGRVFIGTDNGRKRYQALGQRQGVLAAFSTEDGKFLWQDNAPYIEDRGLGSSLQEYTTSTPLIEGDRLYYVTSQAQIRCLDVEAFADNENDGPWTTETTTGLHDADLVWEIDMGATLGVYPHEAPNCSIVSVGNLLMVCTSNGVDVAHTGIPAPRAPSFIGVDKHLGKVVWQVVGPSPRVLHGQWSSPSVGLLGDRPIVFFGGGDGWLYALDPFTGRELWRYDGNPKDAIWLPASDSGNGIFRNNIIASPVFYQGQVLLAMGQDPSHGDGLGLLHKILCGGTDEVTLSHNVWRNRDVHRTIASPIVHEGLVYVGDNYGQVHCIDLETGKQIWMHDQFGRIWGCMLLVGKALYVGDEDGNMTIYRAGRKKEIIQEIQFPAALYAMPAVYEETLFIATSRQLYAVKHD